jgi:hypothetical protein
LDDIGVMGLAASQVVASVDDDKVGIGQLANQAGQEAEGTGRGAVRLKCCLVIFVSRHPTSSLDAKTSRAGHS